MSDDGADLVSRMVGEYEWSGDERGRDSIDRAKRVKRIFGRRVASWARLATNRDQRYVKTASAAVAQLVERGIRNA